MPHGAVSAPADQDPHKKGHMERAGADLITHYLDPDRLPADQRWSRKHAHTQRRLCERFAVPVIGDVPARNVLDRYLQG
jgi:hypothetical protein